MSKTIRLLYPDFLGGGLPEYSIGAKMMAALLPENSDQPVYRVDVEQPSGKEHPVTDGIYAEDAVLHGIHDAHDTLDRADPDRVITIGGDCLVSLAPFDYLHGKYGRTGILWIDAHPDVSTPDDGYPNAHAMVLGSLLGGGSAVLRSCLDHGTFEGDQILYIGLQDIFDYQKDFLDKKGVPYRIQTGSFLSSEKIRSFTGRFDHILIHLDIDVLDPSLFAATYYANSSLTGDGSGGGRMTIQELAELLLELDDSTDIVGLTIAEYLPFQEYKLYKAFSKMDIFR
jgi:arginase